MSFGQNENSRTASAVQIPHTGYQYMSTRPCYQSSAGDGGHTACTIHQCTHHFETGVVLRPPMALYPHTRESWIEQNTAAPNNFSRRLHFDRDPISVKARAGRYFTGPYHTVQERAMPYCRVQGMRHVSLQIACVQPRGV